MKAIKENSILSFNAAGKYAIDFIEFDVQVRLRTTSLSHKRFKKRFTCLSESARQKVKKKGGSKSSRMTYTIFSGSCQIKK